MAEQYRQRHTDGCGRRQASFQRTLAAAYAEAGRFPEAIGVTERALERTRAGKSDAFAGLLENDLRLYGAGMSLRSRVLQPAGT